MNRWFIRAGLLRKADAFFLTRIGAISLHRIATCGSCRINGHLILPELEHDRTHLNRMASKLSLARFARKDFGRLLLRTLMKFCGASMAIGAFVGLVGFSRPFEDELLGIALLAALTAGAFPAWRGARLSPV